MNRHGDLLKRYKELREVGLRLNSRLMETLPHSALDEGGKKLGILKKNVLTLDSEDEIAVLADFCIHDVRRPGANAVDRLLAESLPPGGDEMVLLQALRQARYSLFAVETVEPGVGVHVRDLLRDEPLFLVEVGLSRSAPAGMVLAARVMAPEGISMTTGAALPVGMLSPAERAGFLQAMKAHLKSLDFHRLAAEEASEMAAVVIRTCLQHGAASRIRYVEPGPARAPGRCAGRRRDGRARVGRNDPCPCGSGKKYTLCCGRRR